MRDEQTANQPSASKYCCKKVRSCIIKQRIFAIMMYSCRTTPYSAIFILRMYINLSDKTTPNGSDIICVHFRSVASFSLFVFVAPLWLIW